MRSAINSRSNSASAAKDTEDQLAGGGRGVDGRVAGQYLQADAAPVRSCTVLIRWRKVAPKAV